MAAKPKLGDKLINDAMTCVTIAESDNPSAGEVSIDRIDAFLAAGYRPVKADDEIPLQQHEMNELDRIKNS